MKIFSVVLAAVTIAVVGCHGQPECLLQYVDFECVGQFGSLGSLTMEELVDFCTNGCGQNVAQGFVNCNDPVTAETIVLTCTTNEQGSFCLDLINSNETVNGLLGSCVGTDSNCTGICNETVQTVLGCCGSVSDFIDGFNSNCVVANCTAPFVLGPPSTLAPGEVTEAPVFDCLLNNIVLNQDLQASCSQYIPSFESGIPSIDDLFSLNFPELCPSECSQTIAEAFYECESTLGSFLGALVFGYQDITYAQVLQAGCSTDNLDSSRVCFELIMNDSYGTTIEETLSSEACQQSLQNGDCSETCEEATQSLSCCAGTLLTDLTPLAKMPQLQLLEYCNLPECDVSFPLGTTMAPTTMEDDKAATIHGTVAVLVMIFASLSSLMGYF